MGSPAAVAQLQGWTPWAFRDAVLHSSVVSIGYLSYFCLSHLTLPILLRALT